MNENEPSPFHRSFLLRAAACSALMALVFAAATLLVNERTEVPATAASTSPVSGSAAPPYSTPPAPGPQGRTPPTGAPGPNEQSPLDIDDLADPLEELADQMSIAPPTAMPPELPAGGEEPSTFVTLNGPAEALSLSIPDEWSTFQEPGADVALLAAPDRGDGLPVELLVTWQDLGGQTVRDVADTGRAALAAGLVEFEEQEFEETTLAGRQAFRLHARYSVDDGSGREVETWWVTGAEGSLYVLNASRSDTGDARDWADARDAIASLALGSA